MYVYIVPALGTHSWLTHMWSESAS